MYTFGNFSAFSFGPPLETMKKKVGTKINVTEKEIDMAKQKKIANNEFCKIQIYLNRRTRVTKVVADHGSELSG